MTDHFEDSFNLLCGKLLGEGTHRKVFECKIRKDLVVKVEVDNNRSFANVFEQQFWDSYSEVKEIKKWLAPCEFLSPDARILLQARCDKIPSNFKMPSEIPEFLTDLKLDNFGMLDGRLVCVDYAITICNPSTSLKKAGWWRYE